MAIELSDRQLEIAQLVAAGLEDKEIAKELNIKYGTVRNHIDRIRLKCGCTNRAHFVAVLKDLNII